MWLSITEGRAAPGSWQKGLETMHDAQCTGRSHPNVRLPADVREHERSPATPDYLELGQTGHYT